MQEENIFSKFVFEKILENEYVDKKLVLLGN